MVTFLITVGGGTSQVLRALAIIIKIVWIRRLWEHDVNHGNLRWLGHITQYGEFK
jgi:hypothetical protein